MSMVSPPPHNVEPALVLVDDDREFLQAAARAARDAGVQVAVLHSARDALDHLSSCAPAGHMIIELVMPHSSGRGILGGLEVLKRAAALGHAPRCFLALEEPHADAEALLRELGGAGIVSRPRKGDDLSGYVNPVLERLQRPPLFTPGIEPGFDLARELRAELGDAYGEWRTDAGPVLEESVRSLTTLKALLAELNELKSKDEIPLLVLRFASAFFLRGALFRLDHVSGELAGVGDFGLDGPDAAQRVRAMRIPATADSVFARALKDKTGVRQEFFDSHWNDKLSATLGGPRPREVYTTALVSLRGVEGLLYADDAPTTRPFPNILLLEIFLQQSAAAMERAFLQHQLRRLLATTV